MRSWRLQLTIVVFAVFALAMVDILIDGLLDRGQVFKVVAGGSELISGKLMGDMRPYTPPNAVLSNRIDDPGRLDRILSYEPRDPAFTLKFLELKGRMWRAELAADTGAAAGDYRMRVFPCADPPTPDAPYLKVRIFADPEALRTSQASFFRRHLGVAPWAVTGVLVPVVAWLIYLTFKAAEGSISALQARGLGPIYKMAYRKTGWEILFGLGSDHGLRNGDVLQLLDARQLPVGCEIVAFHVGPQSGEAVVDPAVKLGPGFMVHRPPSQAENLGPPQHHGPQR
ncbi:MAG: hypothetical protein V2L15_01395 [Desulfobacteraceae bacterium]|jgi:hypothetical protein|nr:hypothetical protein [Desulfobacteraceae bacterium]